MIKTLKRLGAYMGGRKYLLPCSVGLSAVNGLLSLVPFILLWLVVRTLLIAKGNLSSTPLIDYALWAFGISVANVLLYFLALMLSHLAAFRIETNMMRRRRWGQRQWNTSEVFPWSRCSNRRSSRSNASTIALSATATLSSSVRLCGARQCHFIYWLSMPLPSSSFLLLSS